ncbi:ran-binding protein 9-like [Rhodnius prolixus]
MLEIMEDSQQETIKNRFSIMYPKVDDTALPKCWNVKDKYRFLYLSNRNLRVHYKGTGESAQDAGSIRATHSIPCSCGVYYFEVKILDKGQHGFIAVGLSSWKSNTNNLPGWERTAYGYHGADGLRYHSSDVGLPYGPKYTAGDVIGCGINFVDKTCFFTKNGHYLGVAFQNIPLKLFPTVGMQSIGEIIEANFGQEAFLFDPTFIKDELKARVKQSIENFPFNDSNKANKLILSYLTHHGYTNSAMAFAESTKQITNEDFQSMNNRKNIMKLIREGKIDAAIQLTNKYYPNLLEKNKDLHFRLLCRQFVELFNETPDNLQFLGQDINTNLITNKTSFDVNNLKILKLGQEIYKFNQKLLNSNLNDLSTRKMKEAFSLIAYNDPLNSNMKWLLEYTRREPICYELNSSILEYVNQPQITSIDLAPLMAKDLLNVMANTCTPAAVFVNVEDYIREELAEEFAVPNTNHGLPPANR